MLHTISEWNLSRYHRKLPDDIPTSVWETGKPASILRPTFSPEFSWLCPNSKRIGDTPLPLPSNSTSLKNTAGISKHHLLVVSDRCKLNLLAGQISRFLAWKECMSQKTSQAWGTVTTRKSGGPLLANLLDLGLFGCLGVWMFGKRWVGLWAYHIFILNHVHSKYECIYVCIYIYMYECIHIYIDTSSRNFVMWCNLNVNKINWIDR